MSESAKYDITNDEQLRILQERLDEFAAGRAETNARLDRMVADGEVVVGEWQAWRRKIEDRLAQPMMNPAKAEEIVAHLKVQDDALAALTSEVNARLAPFERITGTMDRLSKRLMWVLLAFFGGFLYEVGRVVVDRWLK